MKKIILITSTFLWANIIYSQDQYNNKNGKYSLTVEGAVHLASLPLRCINQEFPYKTGVTFSDASWVKDPKNYHPAFYGCFDWHSSVHGHWMLIRLVKLYPKMKGANDIIELLKRQLSRENIQAELRVFSDKNNKTFERTYGWAWILQLQKELLEWNTKTGRELAANVQPLATHFSESYKEFLTKILYPMRVGEHSNLAFGLKLAWDYAETAKDDSLKYYIKQAAIHFYNNDESCPITWEPSGADFLSPCLEEADLMWRVLPAREYEKWLHKFLPQLYKREFDLAVGEVKDRTDGRLVHLDGLNFSRAWCLYGIGAHMGSNRKKLIQVAEKHMNAALPHVASGDYMGEHWLASFAVYALTANNN
ncbi:MAG: DUF2891 domain-containing protein [Chitinophagaceae bacterium]|nr:DUF2891 domain-containing protein [Chitinophagaceae bacterium]